MPCYHPLTAYRSSEGRQPNGKWPIVFNVSEGYADMEVKVPCGQCIGCRLERSRQWAIRCVHEASLYKRNCFITLTYNDENLPEHKTLVKADFQKFMKRLRKRYPDQKIRYFHCGEYGELHQRPHYHACIFNFDFYDKKIWSIRRGVRLYRSATLEKLWPFGHSTIGDVTFESAAYVARYVTKKINGDKAFRHYAIVDEETGEYLGQRQPEYITMSRRPGIGREWFEKFKDDVYPHDYIVIRKGIKCKPPRYYDNIFDNMDPDEYNNIKVMRRINAKKREEDNTPERLKVKEECQKERMKKLIRGLELQI